MSAKVKNYKQGADLSDLTSQQQLFVLSLLGSTTFSIAEAARKAGYKQPNQSGYQLMRNKKIRAAIGRAQTVRNESMELEDAELLRLIDTWASFDPLDLCDEEGRIITDDLSRIPENVRKCINGFKVKQAIDEDGRVYQSIEMMFVKRESAAKLAMLHRGLASPIKHDVKHEFSIDWERFAKPIRIESEHDEIEDLIEHPEKVLVVNQETKKEEAPKSEDIRQTIQELVDGNMEDYDDEDEDEFDEE